MDIGCSEYRQKYFGIGRSVVVAVHDYEDDNGDIGDGGGCGSGGDDGDGSGCGSGGDDDGCDDDDSGGGDDDSGCGDDDNE